MKGLLYFAYGSNLHPVRLTERAPSSCLVGVAELPKHTLRFHKRGACGSGKCNALHTGDSSDRVLGAVYEIDPEEKNDLDRYEGNGYAVKRLSVTVNGGLLDVFAYVAIKSYIDDGLSPFHWYKELVVAGARYHGFPPDYHEFLSDIGAIADPMADRHERHQYLLARMTG